jgi:radical SAM superfamily enzyme YgiQ (UPF0313 family)
MKKPLIVTVPRQDVVRPPGILAILAACCEKVGVEYDVFDLNLHMYKTLPDEQINRLNSDFSINEFGNSDDADRYRELTKSVLTQRHKLGSDLVAISVFTRESILAALELIRTLNHDPLRDQYKIVIGGIGTSSESENITGSMEFGAWCRHHGMVEYVITGEGEISFVELLKGNIHYPGINGIPHQQLVDLDSLPSPSYRNIRPHDYFYSNSPEILITGSKGCVRDCTFCDVGHYWKKYVYRSGEKIAEDFLRIWQDTGVCKFDFSDSLINGSIKSFRQLNRRLIELRQQHPGFEPTYKGQFICRPIGQMKRKDYEEMQAAGAENLVVGIEHFSEHIRQHMRKDFDNASIDWHFATCAELGIKNTLLIMSGYLTESIDDHALNIEYLGRYQKYALTRVITSINIAVGGLMINKGMPLYDLAHDMGLEITADNWQTWINPANPTLTPRERLRRAMEIVYVAAKLGYNVLHFSQKISNLKRYIQDLETTPHKKIIPIALAAEFLS